MTSSTLVQIRVVGVGLDKTVTIEDGSPAALAIEEARGAAAENGDLQVRHNGVAVDAQSFVPQDGDTIVVVPPAVKLGS